MRWRGRQPSSNVEDRRGRPRAGLALGGGGAIIVLLLALVFGVDPTALLEQSGTSLQVDSGSPTLSEADRELGQFVSVVLRDTEDVWGRIFSGMGMEYEVPTLVLFTEWVHSACGSANSAMGPFYCPPDRKVYIDLAFYDELRRRFQAPGDFAQAYVIAHEVGHHVQNLLGISGEVDATRRGLSEAESNALSVRLELQADFLAGVWAHHAQRTWGILEAGDVEEALNAASAIGDDRLQRQSQGSVVPDSFTHGTSAQRVRWFRKGLETGDLNQGDTFAAEDL